MGHSIKTHCVPWCSEMGQTFGLRGSVLDHVGRPAESHCAPWYSGMGWTVR